MLLWVWESCCIGSFLGEGRAERVAGSVVFFSCMWGVGGEVWGFLDF